MDEPGAAGRARLLGLARTAIAERLDRSAAAPAPGNGEPACFDWRRGLFVTLKHDGVLRGCVGTVEAEAALRVTVPRYAHHAAFDDPRFRPVTADELSRLRIEITLLTPPIACPDPTAIVCGRHGVELVASDRRSVFLPQVAADQGWDRDELLRQLALKAGLDGEGWRSARLRTFTGHSFAEELDSPLRGGG